MRRYDGINPTYASSVAFELVQTDPGFAVRIFYNFGLSAVFAPTSIITLPGCTALCPLETFVSLISPLCLTVQQYGLLCALPASPPATGFDGWLVAGPAIAVAGLACAWWGRRILRRRRGAATSDAAHLLKKGGSASVGGSNAV